MKLVAVDKCEICGGIVTWLERWGRGFHVNCVAAAYLSLYQDLISLCQKRGILVVEGGGHAVPVEPGAIPGPSSWTRVPSTYSGHPKPRRKRGKKERPTKCEICGGIPSPIPTWLEGGGHGFHVNCVADTYVSIRDELVALCKKHGIVVAEGEVHEEAASAVGDSSDDSRSPSGGDGTEYDPEEHSDTSIDVESHLEEKVQEWQELRRQDKGAARLEEVCDFVKVGDQVDEEMEPWRVARVLNDALINLGKLRQAEESLARRQDLRETSLYYLLLEFSPTIKDDLRSP